MNTLAIISDSALQIHAYLMILMAALLPISAIFQHVRLKRHGLTPARLFLTLCTILYFFLIAVTHELFGYMAEFIIPIVVMCLLHILTAVFLIPYVYRIGRKGMRIFLSIFITVLLVLFVLLILAMLSPNYSEADLAL